MNGFLLFLLVLLVLVPLAFLLYTLYARRRARALGLPAPPLNPFSTAAAHTQNYPAPSGILSRVRSRISSLTKSGGGRTAGGAYGEPLGSYGGRGRGRGLDPDEAWDARVGAEADGYAGGTIGTHDEEAVMPEYGSKAMGGTLQDTAYIGGGKRGLENRYEEMAREDPFGDEAEVGSLHTGKGKEESPTERRSLFHENV